MRLTPQERTLIRDLGLRHFGTVPRLFGSRLDDSRGGGDIDLRVTTPLPPAEAARRRLDLLADLWIALGEQVLRPFTADVLGEPVSDHPLIVAVRNDALEAARGLETLLARLETRWAASSAAGAAEAAG